MKLPRSERDYYAVKITTNPALDGTWEASFNGGAFIEGTPASGGQWLWLVAGPDFNADAVGMDTEDTQATITKSHRPRLRVKDNPVLDVEWGPRIELVA